MSSFLLQYKGFIVNSSPWYKLLFVFFLVLLFFLFTGGIGLAAVMIIYKLDLQEVLTIMNNPGTPDIGIIRLLQVIQTIGLFIVPAGIASFFLGHRIVSYLKMDKKPSYISIIVVIVSMVIWIPAINFIAGFNARLNLPESLDFIEEKIVTLQNNYNQLTNLFLNASSTTDFIANIAIMAMLPAIGEEMLFRGVFQRLFAELTRNIHWGIIISSLLFSFFHFEFYGFLPRFLLGIMFGYLFAWTASIWIPMLAHFTNNAIIVGYYFYVQPLTGPSRLDELGTTADLSLWGSIGGGIILSALLFYLEKSHRIRNC